MSFGRLQHDLRTYHRVLADRSTPSRPLLEEARGITDEALPRPSRLLLRTSATDDLEKKAQGVLEKKKKAGEF